MADAGHDGVDVQRGVGAFDRQGLPVIAGIAAVGERAEPQLAGLIEDRVTFLEFDDGAAGLEGEDVAVGCGRHLEHAGPHRPILAVEFDDAAAGIARQVGGEVVGGRRPHRPVHEIGARILGVGIAVEEIADREAADDQRDAVDVALARQLVGGVSDVFLFAAESEGLLEIIALRPEFRECRARLLRFAIGETRKAQRSVQAEALREFRVEIEFAALPQPNTEECRRGPGRAGLSAAGQAVCAGIGRSESGICRRQKGRLRMHVPVGRFRQRGLGGI